MAILSFFKIPVFNHRTQAPWRQLQIISVIGWFLLTSISQAKDTVTWAYMADAAPINWQNAKGKPMGMEVEIVTLVLNRLGLVVEHKFFPWERAQWLVKSGKIDGMMTTPTANRFQYAVFGIENTLPNYWNLFIRKNDEKMRLAIKNINSIDDLKPYGLVDFIGNGWTKAFLKSKGVYNILEVPTLEQIPLALARGRQDLIINSSSWTNWWADKGGVNQQLIEVEIDWPWTRFHFVFMVSRKSPWVNKGLVKAMDRELRQLKKEGTWINILKKYKNPHGMGRPFKSHLNEEYLNKFYRDYDNYPLYQP